MSESAKTRQVRYASAFMREMGMIVPDELEAMHLEGARAAIALADQELSAKVREARMAWNAAADREDRAEAAEQALAAREERAQVDNLAAEQMVERLQAEIERLTTNVTGGSDETAPRERTPIDEAIEAWEEHGPTSLTVALLADAVYGASKLQMRLDVAEARIERAFAGAEEFQPEGGLTAGQLWSHLLSLPQIARLAELARLLACSSVGDEEPVFDRHPKSTRVVGTVEP